MSEYRVTVSKEVKKKNWKFFQDQFLKNEEVPRKGPSGSGVAQTLNYHLKWSLEPDVPASKTEKILAKNVPKSTKLAVSGLNRKISKKEKNFAKKNKFFTRFGFSELLSSSKNKKVTAETKISKKRRNAIFGPPELKNGVPQGEKRPF